MPFKPSFDSHFVINELQAVDRVESRFGRLRGFVPLDGWSLSYQGILHISNFLSLSENPVVVELGSGGGTVWLAKILDHFDGLIVSIEHEKDFYLKVSDMIASEELAHVVDYRLFPLVATEVPSQLSRRDDPDTVGWYRLGGFRPQAADVVIIDGPPAGTDHCARFPVLSDLFGWLKATCLIVVDDVDRAHDLRLANQISDDAASLGYVVQRDNVANTAFIYLSKSEVR